MLSELLMTLIEFLSKSRKLIIKNDDIENIINYSMKLLRDKYNPQNPEGILILLHCF